MDQALKEHIQSLIPTDFPDGRTLLQEGVELGHKIQVPRTKFLEKHQCRTYLEYRKKRLAEGKQTWQLLLGLATLEDELDAIRKIHEFSERTGMEISGVQSIPSQIVGLPLEYWDKFPKQTSYEMRSPADWKAHNDAAPIQVAWQDFHLACPAALQTTINALEAGTDRLGCVSTFVWDYTGYYDEKQRFSDMVRSLGILSTKKDLDIDAVTYPEDGLPGYFLDIASWVGYMLVENYIVSDLCHANFGISYGGLLTAVQPRMAFALAMHRLLSTEDHPVLTYFNGGTIDQIPNDINCNFGTGVQEMLIQILFNLKYNTPTIISPVAVTECLRTPSLEELLDIAAAGIRAETKAQEWLPLMDFTVIEEMSELLMEKGQKFFHNVLDSFKEAGVDIEDPLQMIMVLKRFNPVKFEQIFHPSIAETGSFKPYCPSQLGRQTMDLKENIVSDLRSKHCNLSGKRMICASADGHSYGLMLIDKVFSELGASVVNGGVDVEPAALLDLADEEGITHICISTHCGQCLAYAQQLRQIAADRNRTYHIAMGGMFTALLPGNKLPVDVREQIIETGVYADNDIEKQIEFLFQ
ncbi:MAG: cobalamin B12-binding domain-containing protein [Oscillibacter sp.]|nr:cobalamin B12-binding domain-containing protein [Oscillibacter sp.]